MMGLAVEIGRVGSDGERGWPLRSGGSGVMVRGGVAVEIGRIGSAGVRGIAVEIGRVRWG